MLAPRLTVHRCENFHAYFHAHESCPICALRLIAVDVPPDALLVSHTVVRVSPSGIPFALGLARLECGAQTLCIIDGEADAAPPRDVVITKRGPLYHAEAKSAG
jgi:uncharacterized OB-fold protein